MTQSAAPSLRAVLLMFDAATGSLTMQYPPEMPIELVHHLLNQATQTLDAMIRQQNNGLIVPRRDSGAT